MIVSKQDLVNAKETRDLYALGTRSHDLLEKVEHQL